MCITRKSDPALRFLTNRGRETHLLRPSASPQGKPQTAVGQITRKYRAWQALGILSQYKHKMQYNNAAQQRPSEKPASATKVSQKQTLQQPHGPAGMLGQTSELTPWFAPHHPFGEGHGQACSVLGPDQGTEHRMLPLHATQELKQKPVPSQHKEKSAELQQITWTHHHNTALQTPGKTQVTATARYTHSTLLKSSNRPMAAARRRQGQQLYAWYDTPSRRLQTAPPFPLTQDSEAIQPQPPALPLEA